MQTLTIKILFLLLSFASSVYGQKTTTEFSFSFENKKYIGLIDLPVRGKPRSTIILIPGSGKTYFVEKNGYDKVRTFFVSQGFAVCVWDKAGCGKSEGTFDSEQPVQNSADEALAAIREIRSRKIFESGNTGLWGISRAGWICPLIIEKDPSILFWISVSGVDALENFRYLLESNLRIEGRTDEELRLLISEFDFWSRSQRGGKSYEEFVAGTKHLVNDPYCKSLGINLPDEKEFEKSQANHHKRGFVYDKLTGLQIYVPDFDQTLLKVHCPVLAIFGENDSQVDWRKTKSLYEKTIGKTRRASLTVKTFAKCNHNMLTCKTCGYGENLNQDGLGQACEGYYESMGVWLQEQGYAGN